MPEESISLTKYFISLLRELEKRVYQRFKDLRRALRTDLDSLNKRLDAMNEIRGTLKDQQTQFITRAEHNALADRVSKTEAFQSEIGGTTKAQREGKQNNQWLIGIVISIVVVVVIQVITLLRK